MERERGHVPRAVGKEHSSSASSGKTFASEAALCDDEIGPPLQSSTALQTLRGIWDMYPMEMERHNVVHICAPLELMPLQGIALSLIGIVGECISCLFCFSLCLS